MNLSERMKQIIEKSFENTKSLLEKAADKARDFGEKGILKLELDKLEREVEKKFALIGGAVYSILIEKDQQTISKNTPEIKDTLLEITKLEQEMLKKQSDLESIDKD